jgi:hypothetical protein
MTSFGAGAFYVGGHFLARVTKKKHPEKKVLLILMRNPQP